MDLSTCLSDVWICLLDEQVRGVLTLIGASITGVVVGGWGLYLHFKKSKQSSTPTFNNTQSISGLVANPQQNAIQAAEHATVHVHQRIEQGYTLERHEQILRERETQLRADLERAHNAERAADRATLQAELNQVQQAQFNLNESYQQRIAELEQQITHLQKYEPRIAKADYAAAQQALLTGDTTLAKQLYERVDQQGSAIIADAKFQLGLIAKQEIRWREALDYFRLAYTLMKENTKFEHELANMLQVNGCLSEALNHYENLYKKAQPETLEFATRANNLAALYRELGNFENASRLYKEAIEIDGKIFAPNDPSITIPYNNLAVLYLDNCDYEAAESLLHKAVEICENKLGYEHPALANLYNNMATLYKAKENYAASESLYKKAIEIDEKVLGQEHPSVATSYNNLAELYRVMGNHEAAEPLYKKSIYIAEKVLGSEHLHVANRCNNLAELYQEQGKYEAAEIFYEKTLKIIHKCLGHSHPCTDLVLANYKDCLQAQGK